MLHPEEIEALPEALLRLYSQVESDTLADMARRISTYQFWIPAAEHQAKRLEEMGMVREAIVQRLSAISGKTEQELRQLMQTAGTVSLRSEDEVYRRAGQNPLPLRASKELSAILNTGYRQTKQAFQNLTQTTATTASRQFIWALDRAWLQIQSGAFDQTTAIRMAVKDLAKKGVEAIVYPSGHVDMLEVAVRRAAVTGVNKTNGELIEARRKEMGCNLVEVTAHAGARPEHALWQGGIYWTMELDPDYPQNFYEICGYGRGDGIYGWNCRHSHHAYIKGMPRSYSKELLTDYQAKCYTYNGKLLTEYEAMQQQRYIERQIRRWKREKSAMQAAGQDTAESAAKIGQWQKAQREFLQQTGLKRQYDREQIAQVLHSRENTATSTSKSVPKFMGQIDVNDTKLVESKLREFEREVVNEPIEHAYVILQNGKTYRFTGDGNTVDPSVLGSALQGAILSHNHPADQTEYSFSKEDFQMFVHYQLTELRGIDRQFKYILRNKGVSPPIRLFSALEMTETEMQHQKIFVMAQKEGLYYERKKRGRA